MCVSKVYAIISHPIHDFGAAFLKLVISLFPFIMCFKVWCNLDELENI